MGNVRHGLWSRTGSAGAAWEQLDVEPDAGRELLRVRHASVHGDRQDMLGGVKWGERRGSSERDRAGVVIRGHHRVLGWLRHVAKCLSAVWTRPGAVFRRVPGSISVVSVPFRCSIAGVVPGFR